MKYAIALFVALALNASANLMMKSGANRLRSTGVSLDQGVLALLTNNWVLILGLLCFATNVIIYIYALTGEHMKISLAYPIMVGGGFAIVAVVAWRYMGETMSLAQWAGVAFILVGVLLVARGMTPSSA